MTTETEKAPEGASRESNANPESSIPESQGFLEAKEWLGRKAFGFETTADLARNGKSLKCYCIKNAWAALVAVHGEESAKMVLLTKYSDVVKGGGK